MIRNFKPQITLVSGSKGGVIKIWDFDSGDYIRIIKQKLECRGMKIKGTKGLSEIRIKFLNERGAVD